MSNTPQSSNESDLRVVPEVKETATERAKKELRERRATLERQILNDQKTRDEANANIRVAREEIEDIDRMLRPPRQRQSKTPA
jgi:hypothetical protein